MAGRYRAVDTGQSFPALEERILGWWKERSIFEKSLESRAGDSEWVFYEGPPTANGRPGVHHVLARVFKDIYPRYKTMRGYYVARKAGWDCHGLPVELEIERLLGFDHKEQIEAYGVAEFNRLCRESVTAYVDDWNRLTERIGDMIAMVQQARPDLGGSAPAAPPAAAGAPAGAAAAPAGALPAAAPLPPLAVPTHAAARAVLEQVGRYFARFEPGALSMVLVTQARLLIGRPLVEALDVLMESSADGAMIEFGTEGFRIPMSRMRMLSEEGGSTALEDDEAEPFATPQIQSREQVAEALKGVEEFFRLREPASPVPILLFKARNLLNKDFHAIVRELLPPDAD